MLAPVLVFTFVGLLLMGLSLPFLRRSVGPNSWYGLRVPATMADQEVWYEANAKSGRDLLILGLVQLVSALGLPLVPALTVEGYAGINGALITFGAVGAALLGWRRANRLLAEKRQTEEVLGEKPGLRH